MSAQGTLKDRTAIVGIGQTRFGKGIEDSELSLACQAVSAAIDDAGLRPSEVDGLAMFAMESSREVDLARSVGLGDITYFGEIGYGGGAACGTVGHAAMISAGEWVTASGEWTNDRTHGQQFRARFLKTSAPSSAARIRRAFQRSGGVRNVFLR